MDQFLGLVSRPSFSGIWLPSCLSVSLFLPLPPSPLYSKFQAEFPSGAGRLTMSTYLSCLLRPARKGAQGGTPFNIQEGAGGPT